jgi:hypothetical protein
MHIPSQKKLLLSSYTAARARRIAAFFLRVLKRYYQTCGREKLDFAEPCGSRYGLKRKAGLTDNRQPGHCQLSLHLVVQQRENVVVFELVAAL